MRAGRFLGQMVDQTAPYAVLGLASGSDHAAVRDAYRRLARQFHPDVNRSAGAADRMRELNAAYNTLRAAPADLAATASSAAPTTTASSRWPGGTASSAPFGGTFHYATGGAGASAVSAGPLLFVPVNGLTIGVFAGFLGLIALLAVWAITVAKPFAGSTVTVSESRRSTPSTTIQSTTGTLAAQASANAAANAAAARSNLRTVASGTSAAAGVSVAGLASINPAAGPAETVPAAVALLESGAPPLVAQSVTQAPDAPIASPRQSGPAVQPQSRVVQPSIPALSGAQPGAAQSITAVTPPSAPTTSADAAIAQAATRALSSYDKAWTSYAGALRFAASNQLMSNAASAGVNTGAIRTTFNPASLLSGDAQLTMARTLYFQQQLSWNAQSSAALTAASAANSILPRPDAAKTVRAEQRLRQAADLVTQSHSSITPLNTTQLKTLLDEAEQLHRESIAEWARLLASL